MSPRWGRRADERAVSPVVGVVLLVAIVVTLGGVFGGLALGFGDEIATPANHASFETTTDLDGTGNGGVAYVEIRFRSGWTSEGATVYIRDSDGNRVDWSEVWTGGPTVEAGEYVHIDGQGSDGALNCLTQGETYELVQEGEDGGRILLSVEVEESPPAASIAGCGP